MTASVADVRRRIGDDLLALTDCWRPIMLASNVDEGSLCDEYLLRRIGSTAGSTVTLTCTCCLATYRMLQRVCVCVVRASQHRKISMAFIRAQSHAGEKGLSDIWLYLSIVAIRDELSTIQRSFFDRHPLMLGCPTQFNLASRQSSHNVCRRRFGDLRLEHSKGRARQHEQQTCLQAVAAQTHATKV